MRPTAAGVVTAAWRIYCMRPDTSETEGKQFQPNVAVALQVRLCHINVISRRRSLFGYGQT